MSTESQKGCDLTLDVQIAATPAQVWKAWSDTKLLKQWFVPKPWSVAEVELDLVPGGIFRTVMRSPEGEIMGDAEAGCVLVADREARIVFTDALGPGFRPTGGGFMTADIRLIASEGGTLYRVRASHKNEEDKAKHEQMGFIDGWTATIRQLEELARNL